MFKLKVRLSDNHYTDKYVHVHPPLEIQHVYTIVLGNIESAVVGRSWSWCISFAGATTFFHFNIQIVFFLGYRLQEVVRLSRIQRVL